MLKKAFLIYSIVTLCISNIASAAVVSDNDGSAFITKSEFDSLKTSFQSQIDSYRTGIDSKIDSAIASYLSNIKINPDPTNYWKKIVNATGNSLWFANSISSGDENMTPEVVVGVVRELYERYRRPAAWGWWGGPGGSPPNFRHFVNATTDSGSDTRHADVSVSVGGRTDQASGSWTNDSRTAPTEDKLFYLNNNESVSGSGTRWEIHKNPKGYDLLRFYCKNYYPMLIVDVWDHIWFDNTSDKYTSAFSQGGKSYKTKGSGTVSLLSTWGSDTNGATRTEGYVQSSSNYIKTTLLLNKVTDGIDYTLFLYAGGVQNNYIYCSYDDAQPNRVTTEHTISIPTGKFRDLYHTVQREAVQENEIYGYDLKYYYYNIPWYSKQVSSFYNEYVSSATGEDVFYGQGCKILTAENIDEKDYNIKLKLKTNDGTGNIYYIIADKQFDKDGSIPSSNIRYQNMVASGIEEEISLKLTKGNSLYINMYAEDTGKLATIQSFEVEMK